jgi:fatty-acyl-CoA synthase
MFGLMMDTPLLISSIMRHAEQLFADTEIVSITHDHPRHRYTYRDAFKRSRQLANALDQLGVDRGDVIGTLAWNDFRHFEIYYASSCSGVVCHTINPRLFPEQIDFIINHAEDQWLFVDPLFVPLLEKILPQLVKIKGFIVLSDKAHMPQTTLPNVLCYEQLIAPCSDQFEWPQFDERTAAAICYTSGTTGNPKGVVYSHRSTVLHAYALVMPDMLGLGCRDTLLSIVPMFHVNAWGTPYACPMVGAKLVLPGPRMADGEGLTALINEEQVNISAGVPTIWLTLLDYLRDSGSSLTTLKRVIVGGAACPLSVMEEFEKLGVYVHAAWGMTETSPLGCLNTPQQDPADMPREQFNVQRLKAGRAVFGVEMKIVDAEDNELPRDGKAFGSLKVRGPWVCSGYLNLDKPAVDEKGWFDTGDVATISPDGYMQITDRAKDVIKSGGEWISSIELENVAIGHPQVVQAAVIGVPHPKWTERPLLIIVKKDGSSPDKQAILKWFDGKVASWWIPEEVVFVDAMPMTATGKISKKDLREKFRDFSY